jgi:hypothetical protein
VVASVDVEKPPMIALVEYHVKKSAYWTDDGTNFTQYSRVKDYECRYQTNSLGDWTSSYRGKATDISSCNTSTSTTVYNWTNHGVSTTKVDTNDPVSYILESYNSVTGIPDQETTEDGWLGTSGGVGAYPPTFLYHYFADSLHYVTHYADGSSTDVRVKARTRQKLFTGGKAGAKFKSLIRITGRAVQYSKPPGVPWKNTPKDLVVPTRIKVLGWWLFRRSLDADGDLYINMSDNTEKDLNLTIPGVKHYNAEVSVQKVRLDLRQVNFGNTVGAIKQDANGEDYPIPHWQTNETTHIVTSSPVLYVSGSNVEAMVTFKTYGTGGAFPMIIKGMVSGGRTSFTLWGTNTSNVGDPIEPNTYADQSLTANLVDFYNPMTIKWYYGFTNKPDWLYAGTSTNQMYVTWKTPATGSLYHTVVDVACRNATGETTESDILNGIWSDFAGPIPGVKSWDGVEMKYWPEGYNTPGYFFTSDLVRYKEGRCGAWQDFFGNVVAIHAISSASLGVYPNPLIPAPTPPAGYTVLEINGLAFVASSSHPGQGNNQTNVTWLDLVNQSSISGLPIDWGDHGVRLYTTGTSNVIYDPSYGVMFSSDSSLAAAEKAWELYSVVGFCWVWSNPNTGDKYRDLRSYSEVRNTIYPNGDLLIWTK